MSAPKNIRVRRSDTSESAGYRAQAAVGTLEFLVRGTPGPFDTTRLLLATFVLVASLVLITRNFLFELALFGALLGLSYVLRTAGRMLWRLARRVHFIATSEGLHIEPGFVENPVQLSAAEAGRLHLEERKLAGQRLPISSWWLVAEDDRGERIEVIALDDEDSARWVLNALRAFFAPHAGAPLVTIPSEVRALGPRPSRITITAPHADLDRQCGCSNAWRISIRWKLTRRLVLGLVGYLALFTVGIGILALVHDWLFILIFGFAMLVGLAGTVTSLRSLWMSRNGKTDFIVSDQGVQWFSSPLRMSAQPAWPQAKPLRNVHVRPDPRGNPSILVIKLGDGSDHVFEPELQLTEAEIEYLSRAITAFQPH